MDRKENKMAFFGFLMGLALAGALLYGFVYLMGGVDAPEKGRARKPRVYLHEEPYSPILFSDEPMWYLLSWENGCKDWLY
jgi:hypothetical protein